MNNVSYVSRPVFIVAKQPTVGTILEGWFHQNILLQGYPFCHEWDFDSLRDGVVIYLELHDIDKHLVSKFQSKNNKIVLFHFGDELGDKFDSQTYQTFDLILRNYFFKHILYDVGLREKLIWVPNGFKTGVGPRDPVRLKATRDRRILASFLGWIENPKSHNGERKAFSLIAPHCGQNLLLYSTPSFGLGMSSTLYGSIMESSVFAPCPAGNSPETIRLYDALESGCIPISLKHDFLFSEDALLNVPFPVLNSWDELPNKLNEFAITRENRPEIIESLQQRCINWWAQVKVEKTYRIKAAIDRLRNMN